MKRSRALTASEREQEILRISEALAQRGFYVFGLAPATAAGPAPTARQTPPADSLN